LFDRPGSDWPELAFADWVATCDTVHMWTQIVGKTRMALTPQLNHWWHVPLYVTPRGLSTSAIPYSDFTFDVEFDFVAHQCTIRLSNGGGRSMLLYARSVADFYQEYMSCLRSFGIEVSITRNPEEFDDPTPFDEDNHHASYDRDYVDRFHRILIAADTALKIFRGRFLGKCSPVHFFWGSFDLAVTRFNGELCPLPKMTDPVMAEAYSHQVISCGFWPGDRKFPHPAFYAYAVPRPDGLEAEPGWNAQLGEFILRYDDVRQTPSPQQAILDFCQGTYEAAAKLAKWNRAALEL
jgi:hypothetical protein